MPLKAVVLLLCPVPALIVGGQWIDGDLGAMPITEAIHEVGLWTVRFLLLALAVSPFRVALNWPQLLTVRRIFGVTALVYGLIHLLLYALDQKFVLLTIVTEILSRFYLTIGFVALVGLLALGVTSTDAAIRGMGQWWKRLHRLSYPIGILAMLHFFIQSKSDVSQATYAAGLFLWLMMWRVSPDGWRRRSLPLIGLAILAMAATVAVEFAWYSLATRVDASRVAAANLDVGFGLRPAHWVFVTALAVPLLAMGQSLLERLRATRMGAATRVSPPV